MSSDERSGDVHVYFDGAKQQVHVDRDGVYSTRYGQNDPEDTYVEKVKEKDDTIDLR